MSRERRKSLLISVMINIKGMILRIPAALEKIAWSVNFIVPLILMLSGKSSLVRLAVIKVPAPCRPVKTVLRTAKRRMLTAVDQDVVRAVMVRLVRLILIVKKQADA